MRPSAIIVSGSFFGGELEPGVFHSGAIECGTFCGGKIEEGVFHHDSLIGTFCCSSAAELKEPEPLALRDPEPLPPPLLMHWMPGVDSAPTLPRGIGPHRELAAAA